MSLILNIETSTKVCSVALHRQGKVIALQELYTEKSHSSMLTVMVASILQQCEYSLSNLDAVAVAGGPGSYTGLRIGVSTAKGICFSKDIPLITYNSLDTMAENIHAQTIGQYDFYLPMIDARRMEVYAKVFNSQGSATKPTHPLIVDSSSFLEFQNQQLVLFGDGADKLSDTLSGHANITILKNIKPSAQFGNQLIAQKYLNKEFSNLAYFEPEYIKEFRIAQPKSTTQ